MATPLFTIQQAAEHLGVSTRTLTTYMASGHLSVYRKKGSSRKYLDPQQVEELRSAKVEGEKTTVRRAEFVLLRAQVARLRENMEVVLRVLDARGSPIRMTAEYAKQVYLLASSQLRQGGWTDAELKSWAEIFMRIDEADLEKMAKAVEDKKPYVVLLRLASAMIASVMARKDYPTDLDTQSLHRVLEEGRKRLRGASVIFAELSSYVDPDLERFKEIILPADSQELLDMVLRKK
jgi:hypothetical protein